MSGSWLEARQIFESHSLRVWLMGKGTSGTQFSSYSQPLSSGHYVCFIDDGKGQEPSQWKILIHVGSLLSNLFILLLLVDNLEQKKKFQATKRGFLTINMLFAKLHIS